MSDVVAEAASPVLYAGIEGGGTKFVCAVARSPTDIVESTVLPTADPRTTLAQCVRFFREAQDRHGSIASLGFSCFGPLELRSSSADFGRMLATPKPGWSHVDLLAPFRVAFDIPMRLDIDVGAAALAEWRLGAGRGLGSLAYVTVGTGIGGAMVPAGPAVRLMHAEMGHLHVTRHLQDRDFIGRCPFHGDCLEGLASGPAIRARWGCDLSELPPGHAGREIIASYLGQLATSIALMLSVERIVFGGGVMSDGTLVPLVCEAVFRSLNGYLSPLADRRSADPYVCGPLLGSKSGVTGALLLALEGASESRECRKGER
jgi:fructokinase